MKSNNTKARKAKHTQRQRSTKRTQANHLARRASSPIHDTGVFAGRRLDEGTRVIEYAGTIRRWDEYEEEEDPYTCLMGIEDDLVIDPRLRGNIARFINHSCDPNCEAVVEEQRVYIDAIRDIPEGEELTYDYGLTLGKRPSASEYERFACHCGSPRCRGSMLVREGKKLPAYASTRKRR